jgi:hypothetical protein
MEVMAETSNRQNRKSAGSLSPGIVLQTRDIEILEAIAKHRFLRSTHLYALFPRTSEQRIRSRLRLLVRYGYLRKVSFNQEQKQWGGSAPMVIGLGPSGKKTLEAKGVLSPARLAWCVREEAASASTEHQLMISDFLVALAIETTSRTDIELIDEWRFHEEFLIGETIDLWVRVTIDGKRQSIRIIPDAVFALSYKSQGRRNIRVFFLEAYRGRNVVLTSGNPKRKTIFKTLLAYEEIKRQGRTKQYFPYPFTVVVTSNISERITTIREFTRNKRLFRFADGTQFQEKGGILGLIQTQRTDN